MLESQKKKHSGVNLDAAPQYSEPRFGINLYYATLGIGFFSTLEYRFSVGISTTPVEVIAFLAMGLYLLHSLLEKHHWTQSLFACYSDNRPVFFYIFWIILAVFLGLFLRQSLTTFFLFRNLLSGFIAYLLIASHINTNKRIRYFILSYLAGSFIHLLIGVSQALTGGPQLVEENWAVGAKMDPSGGFVSGHLVRGLFNHPNGYAGFFMPILILVAAALIYKWYESQSEKYCLILLLLMTLFSMHSTYAKGAFMWSSLGITFLLIPKILDRWRFYLGLFALVAGVSGLIIYSLNAYNSSGGALGTIETRLQLTEAALTAMQQDPYIYLFGDGQRGAFALSRYFSHIEYPNAHNGIVNIAVFYGFPALFFYLWASLKTLMNLSQIAKLYEGINRTLSIAMFSCILASLANYYFEPHTQNPWQIQFFIFLGLSVSIARLTIDKRWKLR